MTVDYHKPMLDVGSPRVFNCNELTRRVHAKDPAIPPFFRTRPLNNLVLIKDTLTEDERRGRKSAIGTKLYFPFNEQDVYQGGRTIFVHDKHVQQALVGAFGEGAIDQNDLAYDFKILAIFDRLPSLDPFLLKDVFLNEGFTIDEAYFEVGKEIWDQIQSFIIQRFEPVVHAAYPDTKSSDDKARRLIETIWEARDLDALKPLTEAFRLPPPEALEIFSAWKGINFYAFENERTKPVLADMLGWLKEIKLPTNGVTAAELNEFKAALEQVRTQLRTEWQNVDTILRSYQDSYDKMFKLKASSTEFVTFLKNSSKHYWELGNSLGKIGQAAYCWNVTTKRFPGRKLGWEPLREMIYLLAKILKPEQKATTSVAWN